MVSTCEVSTIHVVVFRDERSAAEPPHHSRAQHWPRCTSRRHERHSVLPGTYDVGLEPSNNRVKISRELLHASCVNHSDHISSKSVSCRATNDDGRCPGLITREAFGPGTYKIRFETGQYWEGLGETCFYPYVEVSGLM